MNLGPWCDLGRHGSEAIARLLERAGPQAVEPARIERAPVDRDRDAGSDGCDDLGRVIGAEVAGTEVRSPGPDWQQRDTHPAP
jgi:hypothetical protein